MQYRAPLFGLTIALAASANAQTFRLMNDKGIWWFESPKLGRLWSFGVDCTDLGGPGRADNPSYDGRKLFPSDKAWAEDTLAKFKQWHVNSLGAWSDADIFAKETPTTRLPYFVALHLGSYDKVPWNDLFAPECEKLLSDAARTLIPPFKDDPYLVGYFTDNELGWWDDTLFAAYFKMPASSPGKQKLIETLRSFYHGNFHSFAAQWSTRAKSFDALGSETLVHLKPGTLGIQAVHEWNRVLAERYYSLVYRLTKREDPHHLILGDRYQQFYNLETVRASRPYVDAVSTNAGATWLDGTYPHFYFDTLHRVTGKPVIVTEFYFAARENRTGNRNTGGYFPTVQTQAERAAGFATCLRTFARLPYMVGAHWFQFTDEPPKGRGDGEDYNQGLEDIHGVPYAQMTAASGALNLDAIHAAGAPRFAPGIPRAPVNPLGGELLRGWDRERGFIPPVGLGDPSLRALDAFADLYGCYDGQALYVGLDPMEYMDESLYADGKIPEVDRPLLKLRIGPWSAQIRYNGKDRRAACSDARVRIAERPGLQHLLAVRIPASALGLKRLRRGERVKVFASLTSHGRGYRMYWNSTLTLR